MDQLRVFSEGKVTLAEVQDMLGASGSERVGEFVDHLLAGDLASGLRLVNAVLDEGLDIRQFNRQTVEHLRQLMLIKSGAAQASGKSLIDVTEEMRRRMEEQAAKVGLPDLLRWTKVFADANSDLRSTTYRAIAFGDGTGGRHIAACCRTCASERAPRRKHDACARAGATAHYGA